jgi:perosamine synthetase
MKGRKKQMSENQPKSVDVIPWARPYLGEKEKAYVLQALDSTWISGGEFVDRFESELASLLGKKYAITTSNGTTALHLALLAAGIGPGDEVIVPAFTFVAAANMAIITGAKPVYAAIDPDTWCIDIDSVKKNITGRTKAIIPVHIYGNVCEMEALCEIARESGIYLIEDAAEAILSRYRGRFAGSFGHLGCFSFHATKTITTGEGGAVLTDDEDMSRRMRILRSHGMRPGMNYWHDVIGYNYRLTNLQAALGCAQLENRDWIIKEKERVYQRYKRDLSSTPGIIFQGITEGAEPVIWAVAVKIDRRYFKGDRDDIMAEMLRKGIETRPGFYPFSAMPLYDTPPIPTVESIAGNVVSLPSYVTLPDQTIDYICGQLKSLMTT